ncbi:MAG: hypothetical protein K6B72_08795 [Lachnospiraceae bacterium]|nr:hypothetical protein [Lachnospiraceae bacterium]
MRIKKIGVWTCLLSLCLTLGHGTVIHAAQADEPVKVERPARSLTELTLTGLDEPVPGVPFDTSATIVTAEGITWDIPVIWVDEHGNRVTVPVKGKKYFPAFIFYIPAGYQVADVNASGAFTIRLPDFVTELVGPEGLIFAADPATGITYIFPVNGVPADLGALLPLPSPAPEADAEQEEQSEVPEPERAEQTPASEGEDTPAPAPVPFVSAKVRMYCADSAINTLGNAFLEEFIDLLKNTLVPQVANLLREKFPQSFGSAEPGEGLSSNIGLYIYYVDGEIMGNPAPASALAFNFADCDERQLRNILGLDASSFTEYDAATGRWVIPDYQIANLDNTIVHELLHAFMFDYTRYGMFDTSNERQSYPLWFKEGLASAAENNYMYRLEAFLQFSGDALFEDFHNLGIEGVNPDYSTQNVLNGYLNPYMTTDGAYIYTPGDADPEFFILDMTQDGNPSYVTGYLAVAYLGYMDALYRGQTPIGADNIVNVDVIRGGMDDVLKRLHGTDSVGAQSLDAIIQEISGQRYQGTDDFTAKFIKGTADAQGGYSGDTNDSGTGSLTFVSTFLTWLDSQSNIRELEIANGSLLFQQQDYSSPLDWNCTESSEVYQIPNQAGMIVSSVDLTRANQTGGKSSVGNGTQDYAGSCRDKEEAASEPELLAAKTGNGQAAEEAAVSTADADASENMTDEAAVEQAAEAEPEEAPAAATEAAPESVTESEETPSKEPALEVEPEESPADEPTPAAEPEVALPEETAPEVEPEVALPEETAPEVEPELTAESEAESGESEESEAQAS